MALPPPRIHRREVHRVPVFDFGGLPDLTAKGLSSRVLMEHRNEASVSVFTSRAWRRMFDIRGPLVHELILEFFSRARRRMSWRQFILALRLHTEEEMQMAGISSARDFLGTSPTYTLIRDPVLILCHRLIACSIVRRSQAPKKVTMTNLFYLRGMDVGSINVPYLLAKYLRLFAVGRKSGAHIYGGQFVARLAEHFGLLTAKILGELTVIALELPAWVAMGPERQLVAAVGAPAVAKDAPNNDEGEDCQIRGGRARDTPGIDRVARGQELPIHHMLRPMYHTRGALDRGLARPAQQDPTKPDRPREGNIDEYWWRIYESGNLEVLES
ncbi:hypothetical protein Tco_0926820 [Tanacetum coccineum]|uniref:Uncharacterized protein n=1 Tax=Tanacetum coccineum TaxID=301880 RepID=A0ABQ5DAX3_9ASTR